MKTIVYQSFRTHDVPNWINVCMDTVKTWAAKNQYDYVFIDDELFNKVPDWYRQKVNSQIHLVSDLARLNLAREYLDKEFDRAIWIDADVVIFDQENFQLPQHQGYSFSREVYVWSDRNQQLKMQRRVNNAVMYMDKGNHFLPFYIESCMNMIKSREEFRHTLVGTDFLSAVNHYYPIDHIHSMGLFSPLLTQNIIARSGPALDIFCQHFAHPIYAANLCLTFRSRNRLKDRTYSQVIDDLISSKGEWLNERMQHLTI